MKMKNICIPYETLLLLMMMIHEKEIMKHKLSRQNLSMLVEETFLSCKSTDTGEEEYKYGPLKDDNVVYWYIVNL